MRQIMQVQNHYLGHRKRLRERLLSITNNGNLLANYELLELLLFGVLPRRDTKVIAKDILELYDNSLSKLFFSDFFKLKKVKGMGESSVALLKTVAELIKIISLEDLKEQKNITCLDSQKKLISFLKTHIAFKPKENFCVLFLNAQLQLIEYQINDHGTINKVAIYNREIVKKALEVGAMNIIIAHNHPGQIYTQVCPSEQDKIVTKNLNILCQSLQIELIDHIILSGEQYFSFYDHGLL